jgi:hypothetical protein
MGMSTQSSTTTQSAMTTDQLDELRALTRTAARLADRAWHRRDNDNGRRLDLAAAEMRSRLNEALEQAGLDRE